MLYTKSLVAVHSLPCCSHSFFLPFWRKVKKTKVFEKNPLEGVKFSVQVCYNGFANPDLLPGQRLVGVLPAGPARIKSIFGSGAMPAPVQVKAVGTGSPPRTWNGGRPAFFQPSRIFFMQSFTGEGTGTRSKAVEPLHEKRKEVDYDHTREEHQDFHGQLEPQPGQGHLPGTRGTPGQF